MDPGIDAQPGNVPGERPSRVADVVLRGYDRQQVDEHLAQLEDQACQHWDQVQALRCELSAVHRQLRERERPAHGPWVRDGAVAAACRGAGCRDPH